MRPKRAKLLHLVPSHASPLTARMLAKVAMGIQMIGLAPTEGFANSEHAQTLGYVNAMHDAGLIDMATWRELAEEISAASEARRLLAVQACTSQ